MLTDRPYPPLAALRLEDQVALAFADEVALVELDGTVTEVIAVIPTAVAAEVVHGGDFSAFTMVRPAGIGAEPALTQLFMLGDNEIRLLLALDGEVALIGVFGEVILVRETTDEGAITAIGLDGSVARIGASGRDAILIPRSPILVLVPESRAPFELLNLDTGGPVSAAQLPDGAFADQAIASPNASELVVDLVDAETRDRLGLWVLVADPTQSSSVSARKLEAPSGVLAGYTTDGSAAVVLTSTGPVAVPTDGSEPGPIEITAAQTPFEWSRASLVLAELPQN